MDGPVLLLLLLLVVLVLVLLVLKLGRTGPRRVEAEVRVDSARLLGTGCRLATGQGRRSGVSGRTSLGSDPPHP